MRIENTHTNDHSAFVYNWEDTAQMVALASKAIEVGTHWDYTPPDNGSSRYTVLIKRDKGGGSIMAAGAGAKDATCVFNGYTLVVS
jgi:hypothetical protein